MDFTYAQAQHFDEINSHHQYCNGTICCKTYRRYMFVKMFAVSFFVSDMIYLILVWFGFFGWLADWLAAWLVIWLASWLAGWLAGCLHGCLVAWFV